MCCPHDCPRDWGHTSTPAALMWVSRSKCVLPCCSVHICLSMYPVGYVGLRVSECGYVAPPPAGLTVVSMSHKHLDPYFFVVIYTYRHSSVYVSVLYTLFPRVWQGFLCHGAHIFVGRPSNTWVLEAKGSWRLILGQVAGDLQFWKQTVKM